MRPSATDVLTPKAWVAAGLEALAQFGEPGVKIDVIAKGLKITRGSFYWHFQDRAAFLDALVDGWLRITTIIHGYLARQTAPPEELLGFALLFATQPTTPLAPGGRLEQSLDQWAAYSPKVARVLADNHRLRLQYVERLFAAMGRDGPEAAAESFYSFIVGYNQVRDFTEEDGGGMIELALEFFGLDLPLHRYEAMNAELVALLSQEVPGFA